MELDQLIVLPFAILQIEGNNTVDGRKEDVKNSKVKMPLLL
jgi:hypothetical protein